LVLGPKIVICSFVKPRYRDVAWTSSDPNPSPTTAMSESRGGVAVMVSGNLAVVAELPQSPDGGL
jgi:hypothetical protein